MSHQRDRLPDGLLYADSIGDIWHVRGKWRYMIWDGTCWDTTDTAFKQGSRGTPLQHARVTLLALATPADLRRAAALVMQAVGPRPDPSIGSLHSGRSVNWPAFEAIAARLAKGQP